jgi:hypothetical protein
MLANKALSAAPAAVPLYIEDTFSTYLYTGNGSTQTITNNIDLSGQGGLVWCKQRSSTENHFLFDTARGATKELNSNTSDAEATLANSLTAFNANGFAIGSASSAINTNGSTYASWTFRKQAKFFDVLTYTGNGSNRTISHNLGSTPGCIIIKDLDAANDWIVYHRANTGSPATQYLQLQSTQATTTSSDYWNNTAPTSTVFSLGTNGNVNANGTRFVAYLFAHNAGGFGLAGSDNVISCGSFTVDGSGNCSVSVGYEPQWLMVKSSTATDNWYLYDNMRGFPVDPATGALLRPNTSGAEVAASTFRPTSTGFTGSPGTLFGTGIYIAIRRGPMKTPTSATSVFTPTVYTGTNVDNRLIDTTIAPDMVMIRQRDDAVVDGMYAGSRLTGNEYLLTGTTDAGATDADSFDAQIVSSTEYGNAFSSMNGVWVGNDATRKFNANTTSDNHVIHSFKRAPGFFDVVCYTGTGANRTVSHNLGVVPELMIVKRRGTANDWAVYANNDNTDYLVLNTTAATADDITYWNDTSPTSSVFTVGTNDATNASGSTYVAYLFASLTGISKVGTYTGNGSSSGPTITTGFSPRYLLIKSISTSGEWIVYDTARGLGSGNEPTILLNTPTAEYSANYVSTSSTGFQLVSNSGDINSDTQTYLYLAIA